MPWTRIYDQLLDFLFLPFVANPCDHAPHFFLLPPLSAHMHIIVEKHLISHGFSLKSLALSSTINIELRESSNTRNFSQHLLSLVLEHLLSKLSVLHSLGFKHPHTTTNRHSTTQNTRNTTLITSLDHH